MWTTLTAGGAEATARVIDGCVVAPARADRTPPDPYERAAQYLWLQARSAGTIPVWWDGIRWTAPTGARVAPGGNAKKPSLACQAGFETGRGSRGGGACQKTTPGNRCRGIVHVATMARRLRSLPDLSRVEVVHGDLRSVSPIPGAAAYFDPPYRGCPRYAALCPRAAVEAVALRWAAAGARVLVSEAEPLLGWASARLPARKPEWLSASWPLHVSEVHGPLFARGTLAR